MCICDGEGFQESYFIVPSTNSYEDYIYLSQAAKIIIFIYGNRFQIYMMLQSAKSASGLWHFIVSVYK